MILSINNILLVSGSGQNVGKTTLMCGLIARFSKDSDVVAVKMSHHFKPLAYPLPIVAESDDFLVYEETESDKTKDSSRMFKEGAAKAFYITSEKGSEGKAILALLEVLAPHTLIICESGGLANHIQAGLHLHLKGSEPSSKQDFPEAVPVHFDGSTFDIDIENIHFENNSWTYNP